MDKECNFYAARLYAQSSPKGQAYEMIHDLDKMVKSLLNEHFRKNNAFPKKIVFYRDGVSEGQFPIVSPLESVSSPYLGELNENFPLSRCCDMR